MVTLGIFARGVDKQIVFAQNLEFIDWKRMNCEDWTILRVGLPLVGFVEFFYILIGSYKIIRTNCEIPRVT